MRPTLALAALLVLPALAGCLAADTATTTPPSSLPFRTLRCVEAEDGARTCNFRVTHENGPANEVSLSVNPRDPDHVVGGAKDYTYGEDAACGGYNVWAGHYWSIDGGRTWGNGLLPGHDPADGGALAGYACITDAVVVFSPDGTPYFSGLAYNRRADASSPQSLLNAKGSNVFVAASRDGGRTYADVSVVAEADGDVVFHDKQWFAFDPNDPRRVYITWSAFVMTPSPPVALPAQPPYVGQNQVVFASSSDGGRTWTPYRPIAEVTGPDLSFQFAMPQVDPEGRVHVIYYDYTRDAVMHLRSDDRGQTFGNPVAAAKVTPVPGRVAHADFRVSSYPVLAVDTSDGPHRGRLHVVWADHAKGDADILAIVSDDGGATWSLPVQVNDDGSGHDQFFPWIDVGPTGDVHVVFLDRRYDPDNTLVDLTYARSNDGQAWDPNLRVTEQSFDPSLSHHQSGAVFLGDYIAVDAHADVAYAFWPDTRHGRADVFAAAIER